MDSMRRCFIRSKIFTPAQTYARPSASFWTSVSMASPGIELRREIAIAGVSIPVVFITADDSDTTRKAAIEAGCVAYLTKPFTAKSLIEGIARASDNPRQTE